MVHFCRIHSYRYRILQDYVENMEVIVIDRLGRMILFFVRSGKAGGLEFWTPIPKDDLPDQHPLTPPINLDLTHQNTVLILLAYNIFVSICVCSSIFDSNPSRSAIP